MIVYEAVSANEWLYPDSRVSPAGRRIVELSAARGSYAACQILFNGAVTDLPIRAEWTADGTGGGLPGPELYQLIDVCVEKNTGPAGFCAGPDESAASYATRLAPFRVYDALRPLTATARARGETEALYAAWRIPADAAVGRHEGELVFAIGEERCRLTVAIEVFGAVVPARETLSVTNWFSLADMAGRHGLAPWSEGHWDMIRRYGELMRHARQTHFWVPTDIVDVGRSEDGGFVFGFDKAERLIRLYLGLGFSGIEGGMTAGRQHFRDSEFVVRIDGRAVKAISEEGYAYLSQYLTAWHAFLQRNGWLDITLQHVADEPTEACAHEYRVLSGIVRKHMPGVPLLEAVETTDLHGAVDIWIPKNSDYEKHRESFERIRALGDRLWFYTCCIPGGRYMNRLWDMPLLRTRYLHWGNYIYRLEGYLHWGFNHCDDDRDPFEQTELFFPPGDTHIVYPGQGGPWGSMRLEAMRAGIEDYELLRLVAAQDPALADEIAGSCMTGFSRADEDPVRFAGAHRRLLQAASDAARSTGLRDACSDGPNA